MTENLEKAMGRMNIVSDDAGDAGADDETAGQQDEPVKSVNRANCYL